MCEQPCRPASVDRDSGALSSAALPILLSASYTTPAHWPFPGVPVSHCPKRSLALRCGRLSTIHRMTPMSASARRLQSKVHDTSPTSERLGMFSGAALSSVARWWACGAADVEVPSQRVLQPLAPSRRTPIRRSCGSRYRYTFKVGVVSSTKESGRGQVCTLSRSTPRGIGFLTLYNRYGSLWLRTDARYRLPAKRVRWWHRRGSEAVDFAHLRGRRLVLPHSQAPAATRPS